MKRKALITKELSKFSSIVNIDLEILEVLNEGGYLDVANTRACLIKFDFDRISGTCGYTKGQVVLALAKEYGMSKHNVEAIIYEKKQFSYKRCIKCGSEMSKYKHSLNKGVCDDCTVNQIVL